MQKISDKVLDFTTKPTIIVNNVYIMPSINRKEIGKPWKASSPKSKKSWGHDTDFYRKKAWRTLRRSKLFENPLCEECEKKGIVTSADVVDHEKPRRLYPELELEWSNLQSLCHPCHNSKSSREGRGSRNLQKQPSINR